MLLYFRAAFGTIIGVVADPLVTDWTGPGKAQGPCGAFRACKQNQKGDDNRDGGAGKIVSFYVCGQVSGSTANQPVCDHNDIGHKEYTANNHQQQDFS